jgi:transcriptional regulator with XRE-family HTH domain
MLFQIESDRFESAYADLLERIQNAIQQTYHEEKEARGLTRTAIAEALGIDLSVVSRRLNGGGNITLRTISDTYTAMDREPLSNFVPPRAPIQEDEERHTSKETETRLEKSVIKPNYQNPSEQEINNVATLFSRGQLIMPANTTPPCITRAVA